MKSGQTITPHAKSDFVFIKVIMFFRVDFEDNKKFFLADLADFRRDVLGVSQTKGFLAEARRSQSQVF
jgi:hypothetical protein